MSTARRGTTDSGAIVDRQPIDHSNLCRGGRTLSRRICTVAIPMFLLVTAGVAAERESASSQTWRVPGDVPEMMAACQNIPELHEFSRDGYLSIECGYQAILLGSRIPIAPAPHIPWPKPYLTRARRVGYAAGVPDTVRLKPDVWQGVELLAVSEDATVVWFQPLFPLNGKYVEIDGVEMRSVGPR